MTGLLQALTFAAYAAGGLLVIAGLGVVARALVPLAVHVLIPLTRAVLWPMLRVALIVAAGLAVRYVSGATFWPWQPITWSQLAYAPSNPRRLRGGRGIIRWRDWSGWERAVVRNVALALALAGWVWPTYTAAGAASAASLATAAAVRQRRNRRALTAEPDRSPRVVRSRAGEPYRPRTGPPPAIAAYAVDDEGPDHRRLAEEFAGPKQP